MRELRPNQRRHTATHRLDLENYRHCIKILNSSPFWQYVFQLRYACLKYTGAR